MDLFLSTYMINSKMLLLVILVLPAVLGADREWNFGKYVIKTNEKKALTSIEKVVNETLIELNLSNLGLRSIDLNTFDNVTNIRRLNLANNWLTTLPKYVFSNLTNLQQLSLADNNISSFDRAFIGLTSLQTLDLSNNPLQHIGHSYFYGLSRYVDILMRGNAISNMSTFLFSVPYSPREETITNYEIEVTNLLTNLPANDFTSVKVCIEDSSLKLVEVLKAGENVTTGCSEVSVNHSDLKLSLRDFDIQTFVKGWYQVKDLPLKSVDLSYNRILQMTSEILNDLPENIFEVDMSHNRIGFLRSDIIENWHLRSLILDYNYIDKIDNDSLAKMNLWFLSLNNNLLKDTKFFETLPLSIVQIQLSGNDINRLSAGSLLKLERLEKLDLSSNKVTVIEPGFFANSRAMKELNLSNNMISLYKGIFEGLESIEYLNIGMNELKNVTKNTLYAMPDSLSTVILDFNGIQNLDVGSFVRVPTQKLSLVGNNITTIVKGSFDLPTLRELDLGKNQLSDFDSNSFKGLANLTRLSLADNNMTKLERGVLKYLSNLEILDLSLNPLKELVRGALNGMVNTQNGNVFLSGVPIELIQGTIFEYTF